MSRADTAKFVVVDENVSSIVGTDWLESLEAWANTRLADDGDAPVSVERWDGVDVNYATTMAVLAGRE